MATRAIGACDRARVTELIDRLGNPQLNHYGRAGAQQGTRLAT
jgi:hypothetical protein